MNIGSSGGADTARSQAHRGRFNGLAERLRRLMPTRDEARRHWVLRRLGPLLEREWLWRLNRRTVASGAALGVFFGLVIPVGQMPLAAAGAILLRAHLPAAALGTLVSNPFTVGPIYWLAHRTGAAILDLSGYEQVGARTADDLEAAHITSADWIQRIADVGAPLMVGLALFAACGAVLAYLAVRLIWRWSVLGQRRRPRAFGESGTEQCPRAVAVASTLTSRHPSMPAGERNSIISNVLNAAFADSLKPERERAEVRGVALSLGRFRMQGYPRKEKLRTLDRSSR